MSGGKKNNGKSNTLNNPFKVLKGFSVSGASPSQVPVAKKESRDKKSFEPQRGDVPFAEAMEELGVTRMGAVSRPERPTAEQLNSAPLPPPEDEQELFLDALRGVEVLFKDDYPLEEEKESSPRRMKLLRQGKLAPEAKLDLHGSTREEARQKVRHFLEDSTYKGKKVVLVVTGKGKGSEGEPVLRAEIERYLRFDASAWVVEWGRAPGNYGGEGALVVFLKQRKNR